MKFNSGDRVFHLKFGIGVIVRVLDNVVSVKYKDFAVFDYDLEGKSSKNDKNPVLWTLEEAKEKGYGDQIPDELLDLKWEVLWDYQICCFVTQDGYHMDAEMLKGKRGTLHFVEDTNG